MRSSLGSGNDLPVDGGLRILAAFLVLVFGVFGLRLIQLQVIEGEAFLDRSERNSVRTLRVTAPRGDIVDREGRALVTTRPAFGVQVIPNGLGRPEVTFSLLARLLEADAEALRERVGAVRGRARYQPVRLAGDLAYAQLARVESHRYALPGVVTDVRPRRDYVYGGAAAHLLGTLGEVTAAQLARREYASHRAGEVVGQSGVEALLEESLRGRDGGRNVVVDAAGREVELLDEVASVRGGTAVLALDLDLQLEATRALDASEGPAGAVVALDPRNGDVLALVSRPAFDPNDFAAGIDAETWQALRDDEWKPLQNRALSGQYPPGSTYKAIVAAAALEEGVVEPEERFFCPGHFRLGRRVYRCWKRPGHGWVDLHQALVHSCDVFFYNVGLELGIDRLAFFARGFGLGRTTALPLPGERAGLVPTRAWKQRRLAEPWVRGETVSASIGQGFNLVTPLQLAVAFAALANGGRTVEPRLVLRVFDRDGQLVQAPAPSVRRTVPVGDVHLARVRRALEGVVMEPRGTGARARVPGVRVAGKTGTAQVVSLVHTEDVDEDEVPVRHRDHAWFAAFAPADAPEIVVVVLVEHGGGGGAVAAPVAGRILTRYFEKRQPEVPAEMARAAD